MKSPFGRKLFRLFLVFALAPSVIFLALAYYLSTQGGISAHREPPERIAELTGYYNDYIFGRIHSELRRITEGNRPDSNLLDFVILADDSSTNITALAEELTPQSVDLLVRAARTRTRGFIQSEPFYYQFVAVTGSSQRVVIGGVVHGPPYASLMGDIESDLASASSGRALASKYLVFLALLFLIVAGITVTLAYLFSSKLANSLAAPLAGLSEASRKIADGDFEQQVAVEGIGEVRVLIENFNSMARQLRVTTSRLAQTERVAAWRNVARRFAHELKNPLQPITVSLYRLENALKDCPQYEAQLREPLRAASEELRHLTELADRFSQLAKLPEPQPKRVALNEVLRTIFDLYQADLNDFDFQLRLPEEDVTAVIDETYFREVVHNLLKNAIDASDKGASIILTLRRADTNAEFILQDFGKGMNRETASSARIPYFSTKAEGTGLGLAIVDKIVSELSGSLIIDSAEGRGTTVTVSIPAG